VKADGLAARQGRFCLSGFEAALAAVGGIMREREFGAAGEQVVVEEFLRGEEASFMAFCDGERFFPMAPSQDHKAIYDGDKGPNTGGMGAYSIDQILTAQIRSRAIDDVLAPTIKGMAAEGNPYRGILYAGLMLTEDGPKVLEFNVRFGDPETQVVLPRLDADLLPILEATARGDLRGVDMRWNNEAAVCVVVASAGYPGAYEKGKEITGLAMASDRDSIVFHAGQPNAMAGGHFRGRVLGVTARAGSLDEAILRAYEGVNKVYFEGMYYRRDIAAKGLRKIQGT
jgi:phosphoribosylamine--glycine ligase